MLDVTGLSTYFGDDPFTVKAVNDISFSVGKGKIVGLVGESGSGKSITGLSIMRLIEPPGRIVAGVVRLNGMDLLQLPERRMRQVRGSSVAMVFQDPMMTLNPVLRIKTQMIEMIQAHQLEVSYRRAWELARDALGRVGIPSPEERLEAYPHQLSGGMRQRVAIATSILNRPSLIIADEPTTALDVTIQAQIIWQLQKLQCEESLSILWVTHDLSVIESLADDVLVMYAGHIVERGRTSEVLSHPAHPYTRGLIDSVPSDAKRGQRLTPVPGSMPLPWQLPSGCAFRNRCCHATEDCAQPPPVELVQPTHSVSCFHPQHPRN